MSITCHRWASSRWLVPIDRLRRLHHLRRGLDRWNADGGAGPMPQPAAFGLKLPKLKPSEILWRMEGRP